MPGPPLSQKLLEAADLIRQGATPSELEKAGFPHALVYRANRVAKIGAALAPQVKLPVEPPQKLTVVDTTTGEIREKSVSGGHKFPILDGKTRLRSQTLPGSQMTMVQDYYDPTAQSLTMITKTLRMPMPLLLPTLVAITKTEWGLGDIPIDRLLNAVIESFLRDRGFLVGPWTKLAEAEKYIQEVKRDGSGIEVPASSQPGTTTAEGNGAGGASTKAEETGSGEGGIDGVEKDGIRVREGLGEVKEG